MENGRCEMWPDTPQHCATLSIFEKIFCALSIVGTLPALGFMVVQRKYHALVQKLVLLLVLNTFFFNVCMTAMSSQGVLCVIKAFLHTYFHWVSVCCTFAITLYLFLRIRHNNAMEKHQCLITGAILLVPLVPASVPLIMEKYGPAGVWCWIKKPNMMLRFGIFYIPLIIVLCIEVVMCVFIVVEVYQNTRPVPINRSGDLTNQQTRREIRPLVLYPIIFILLYLPFTIFRVEEALNIHGQRDFTLAATSVIASSSLGLVLSIIHIALVSRLNECLIAVFNLRRVVCCKENYVEHNIEVLSRSLLASAYDQERDSLMGNDGLSTIDEDEEELNRL